MKLYFKAISNSSHVLNQSKYNTSLTRFIVKTTSLLFSALKEEEEAKKRGGGNPNFELKNTLIFKPTNNKYL